MLDPPVQRHELQEVHYITAISNVASICSQGILSHGRASNVAHTSVAMTQIQDLRAKVTVPGGARLHSYANLYICARNPMLYKLRSQHASLCVLRISPDVLDLPGAIVTDGNAAGKYVRFAPAPRGLRIVDRELTFAEYRSDSDYIAYCQKKSAKCAEVLVPDRIDPSF